MGIIGEDADLTELASHLTGNVTVAKAEDGWHLSAAQFENLDRAEQVRAAGEKLIRKLNGLAKARIEGARRITIGNVRYYRPDGTKDAYVFPETLRLRARLFVAGVANDGPVADPPSWIGDLGLAERDRTVAAALDFLAVEPPTWTSIAAALDAVTGDKRSGGEEGVRKWGNVSGSQIKRLHNTANSYAASGSGARHAPGFQQPKKPMTIEEAAEFVRRIVRLWLDELARLGV